MKFYSGPIPMSIVVIAGLAIGPPLGISMAYASLTDMDGGVTFGLASRLQNPPARPQELFSHALRIIQSVETSPSCNRVAALNLINSCQSPDASSKGPDSPGVTSELVLEEVKSEYAARLAVCELLGASATVPRDCEVFEPSLKACVKPRLKNPFARHERQFQPDDTLCYPERSQQQFAQCLRSLESRPQWWTSYSNARQNAVVMCQASRDAIEKDQKITLYKSLADATSDITSALLTSLMEAEALLAEHKAFVEELKASQIQTLNDLKKGRERSVSALSSVTEDMRSAAQSMIDLVTHAFMRAEARIEELNESIHESNLDLQKGTQETREGILDIFKDVAVANLEHTALQTQHWQTSHQGALAVQQALDMVRASQLQAFAEVSDAFGSLRNQLFASTEHITNINERLSSMDTTFDNLQSTIDETTEKIQRMTILGGFGIAPKWGGIILVIVGVWFASKRLAGYIAIISGVVWLLHSAGASTWINKASAITFKLSRLAVALLSSPIPPFIKFAMVAIIAVSVLVGFAYLIGRTYIYAYEDDQGELGLLLKVENPELPVAGPRRALRHYNIFSALQTR